MKYSRILLFIFLCWTLIGCLSKIPFFLVYNNTDTNLSELFNIIWHGLGLDLSIAGYLSIIPGIILLLSASTNLKFSVFIWRTYFVFASFILCIAFCTNIGLYGYWGYPLDYTPILYLKTSPSDAIASMSFSEILIYPISILALTFAFVKLFWGIDIRNNEPTSRKYLSVLFISMLSMFVPIRGGFGTGSIHTSDAYFSSDMRKNHAAINPLFCFMESTLHQKNLREQYHYMADKESERIFNSLTKTELAEHERIMPKHIVLVILESFSRYIMSDKGNYHGVTPNLDNYSQEGWFFTRFYANSIRTDRAMTSIISGIPALPTFTLMDQPHKTADLPSIGKVLNTKGYISSYYYGGSTNYSNIGSYLTSAGFRKIISEKDFKHKQRTSKWGVPDGPVFDRALKDIKGSANTHSFIVIQTSSSHEPFDVPYHSNFDDERLNAFAYADSCLGSFVENLRKLPSWGSTLLIIVPDHLGVLPKPLNNYAEYRYEIPLIFMGGVITEPKKIETIGCQADIAATLLGLMGIEHSEFIYSKDLFDSSAPHFAVFSFPDAIGMVDDENLLIYDNSFSATLVDEGTVKGKNLSLVKAYFQYLHADVDRDTQPTAYKR